jgi:Lhr-like helicase
MGRPTNDQTRERGAVFKKPIDCYCPQMFGQILHNGGQCKAWKCYERLARAKQIKQLTQFAFQKVAGKLLVHLW